MQNKIRDGGDSTLVEEVLRQSGKSDEEAGSIGKVEKVDEEFENTFDENRKTGKSPVSQVVWTDNTPISLFGCVHKPTEDAAFHSLVDESVQFVKNARERGTLFGPDQKLTERAIEQLGEIGYWGMLVPNEYGGSQATIYDFMRVLTRMSKEGDPNVAGLASIHQCIGAVDPIAHFGSDYLKSKYLPLLAMGRPTSGFALTERGAGSDLTAVQTTAELKGDVYVVNGRKMFISNSFYGRILGLVVMLEGKPAVMIAELPDSDKDGFTLESYELHALTHLHNHALHFDNFEIPKDNLIVTPFSGLTIAYHGLNRGRIAIAANGAGWMCSLLASTIEWAKYRKTYGQYIKDRELVKSRVSRAAGLIVETEALRDWSSEILDNGYRGELECMLTKIRGSTNLVDLAILVGLRTHGGRTFLGGNPIGDDLHDIYAPSIYEGENDMLKLAFFKTLAKPFFEKLEPAIELTAQFQRDPYSVYKPRNIGSLMGWLFDMLLWVFDTETTFFNRTAIDSIHPSLQGYVSFALGRLLKIRKIIYRAVCRHKLKLVDMQMFIIEDVCEPAQDLVAMLVTAAHASQQGDEVTIMAAQLHLKTLKNRLTGKRPNESYRKASNRLADAIYDGAFLPLNNAYSAPIQCRY